MKPSSGQDEVGRLSYYYYEQRILPYLVKPSSGQDEVGRLSNGCLRAKFGLPAPYENRNCTEIN